MRAESAKAVFAAGSVLSEVIARNKVVVQDASRTLNCQLMTLFFEQIEGQEDTSISRARAEEDVSVHYRESEEGPLDALCDMLEWDSKTDNYTLTGDPAELKRGGISTYAPQIVIHRSTGRVDLPLGKTPVGTTVEGELQ